MGGWCSLAAAPCRCRSWGGGTGCAGLFLVTARARLCVAGVAGVAGAAVGLPFLACAGTVVTVGMGAALPLLRLAARREGRGLTLGGVVLTVNGDGAVVERQLAGGELCCPSCGGARLKP